MITREQVADLRPGDVVELWRNEWPDGTTVRGPLYESSGYLHVAAEAIRNDLGQTVKGPSWFLTVVSRASRPLYVNHDRTEPVPGDVVRQEGGCPAAHTWHYLGDDERAKWWRFDDTRIPFDEGAPLRLLVDGETGQVLL